MSYEKLSSQKDDIRKVLTRKIIRIEELRGKVESEIARLNEKKVAYSNSLKTINDPNPEIERTRKESLAQAIKYIDAQIRAWTEFNGTEAAIQTELGKVQQRIGSFLSIIDSSAIVFREGLNLLRLQSDIRQALSLFTTDLPEMERLSREMEESWSHLDSLVGTLTSTSIPAPSP